MYNIISISEKFEIVSRKSKEDAFQCKTITKFLDKSTITNAAYLKCLSFEKGTRISIYNLFHNIPVKKQQLNEIEEKKNLKNFLEQISLFYYDISINVIDLNENKQFFQSTKTNSIKSQFGNLFGINFHNYLKPCSLEADYKQPNLGKTYKVGGLFSIYTHNVALQFIYLNKYLIENSNLYTLLNKRLSIVNMCSKKNINCKYPVYLICLSCPQEFFCLNEHKNKKMAIFTDNDYIVNLLENLVDKFLTSEGFRINDESNNMICDKNIISEIPFQHPHCEVSNTMMSKTLKKADMSETKAGKIEKTDLKRKLKYIATSNNFKKIKNSHSISKITDCNNNNQEQATQSQLCESNLCSWFDLYGNSLSQINHVESSFAGNMLDESIIELVSNGNKNLNQNISNIKLNEPCCTASSSFLHSSESQENKFDDKFELNFEKKNIWHDLFTSFKPRSKLNRDLGPKTEEINKQQFEKLENFVNDNLSENKWRNKEDKSN